MTESALWFAALMTAGGVAFAAALRLGRTRRRAVGSFALLAAVLFTIVWIQKHPQTALKLAPSNVLVYLEGTAIFPAAMAILGVAWAHGRRRRQRVLTAAAMVVALAGFLHGAWWMVQATPHIRDRGGEVVAQSTDYSCVAAACATALNKLNVPTREADMVALARVKPGRGATVLRALDGLNRRLQFTPWRAKLTDVGQSAGDVRQTPTLVTLRLGRWNTHMVAVVESHDRYVVIADPIDGLVSFPREMLAAYAEPTAIVFERDDDTPITLAMR